MIRNRVTGWKMRTGIESVSDHLYISMALLGSAVRAKGCGTQGTGRGTRWDLRRLDEALFQTVIVTAGRWAEKALFQVDRGNGDVQCLGVGRDTERDTGGAGDFWTGSSAK